MMITWDFEIGWLWNFSDYSSFFLMVLWRFIVHRCGGGGIHPWCINRTLRTKGPVYRRSRTTASFALLNMFSWTERNKSGEPLVRSNTPSKILETSCPISWPLVPPPPPSQLQCDWGLSKHSIMCRLSFPIISRSLLSLFLRHKQHVQTPDRPEQWPSALSLPGLNCYHLSLIPTLTINCMSEHFKALYS